MTDRKLTPPGFAETLADFQKAKEARARWADEEKRLKAELFAQLGYKDDEKEPVPADVVDPASGEIVATVKVGTWRGMDFNYLKNAHPDIYAECETSKATKTIKLP